MTPKTLLACLGRMAGWTTKLHALDKNMETKEADG